MDITKLSKEVLKLLVFEFQNNNKPGLHFEEIQAAFQDITKSELIKAISILASNRYVSIFDADNIPYFVTLEKLGLKVFE